MRQSCSTVARKCEAPPAASATKVRWKGCGRPRKAGSTGAVDESRIQVPQRCRESRAEWRAKERGDGSARAEEKAAEDWEELGFDARCLLSWTNNTRPPKRGPTANEHPLPTTYYLLPPQAPEDCRAAGQLTDAVHAGLTRRGTLWCWRAALFSLCLSCPRLVSFSDRPEEIIPPGQVSLVSGPERAQQRPALCHSQIS
jgi:hypothetical protein